MNSTEKPTSPITARIGDAGSPLRTAWSAPLTGEPPENQQDEIRRGDVSTVNLNGADTPGARPQDAGGYPQGLAGEEIPLSARLFAVVDVWDTLLSDRPYREAWPEKRVLEYIREHSGTLFDPQIVAAFFAGQPRKAE